MGGDLPELFLESFDVLLQELQECLGGLRREDHAAVDLGPGGARHDPGEVEHELARALVQEGHVGIGPLGVLGVDVDLDLGGWAARLTHRIPPAEGASASAG